MKRSISAVSVGEVRSLDARFALLRSGIIKKTRSLLLIAVSCVFFATMIVVTWRVLSQLRPLPRHHPFFKQHHVETGRSAMLRHASHYAQFVPPSDTRNETTYKVGM
jgi:hypothetical protein